MKKTLAILLLVLFTATSTGCWDYQDIEKRGYVIGIALDSYQATKKTINKIEEGAPEIGQEKYLFTVQIPIWKKGQLKATGSGGGGTSEKESNSWQEAAAGDSLVEMNRELTTRISIPLTYQDLDVFIISKQIAMKGISNWIDAMLRFPEIRQTLRFFVAENQAKAILETNPKIENYSSFYLAGISENKNKPPRIAFNINLGQINEYLLADLDFALPLIEGTSNEIKGSGTAVIKKDRMVGQLNEVETEAYNLLTNNYNTGVITVPCWVHKGQIIAIGVTHTKCKITPEITDKEVKFKIKTQVEGNIAEVDNFEKHQTDSVEFKKNLKVAVNNKVKENMQHTISKLQSQRADAVRFASVLRRKEYGFWQTNKEKWREEIFPQAIFEIDVHTEINNTGATR